MHFGKVSNMIWSIFCINFEKALKNVWNAQENLYGNINFRDFGESSEKLLSNFKSFRKIIKNMFQKFLKNSKKFGGVLKFVEVMLKRTLTWEKFFNFKVILGKCRKNSEKVTDEFSKNLQHFC